MEQFTGSIHEAKVTNIEEFLQVTIKVYKSSDEKSILCVSTFFSPIGNLELL